MRVAIIGAGPSGATLATLLAGRGVSVTLFDDGRKPELIVGESLVPAVVPILRRLGVEERVREIGIVKPGVSFYWSDKGRLSFSFERVKRRLPPYAYNVPRAEFDRILLERARTAGAEIVPLHVKLEASREGSEGSGVVPSVLLGGEALAASTRLAGHQPDLIVDATGRARRIARLLDLPAHAGPRNDVAHFGHFEGFTWPDEPLGQVLIGRMASGWSWRIPLRDRLSVGIVVPRARAEALGDQPESRLRAAIADDAILSETVGRARLVTKVATYNNYQLTTRVGFGGASETGAAGTHGALVPDDTTGTSARTGAAEAPRWAMIGDAFGFVDPMLSPGVFLALRSAELLADGLLRAGSRPIAAACSEHAARFTELLSAWTDLISYFYDGRMFALYHSGRELVDESRIPFLWVWQDHIERHIAWMASGAATTSRYSRGLLRFLAENGLRGFDPAEMAIR